MQQQRHHRKNESQIVNNSKINYEISCHRNYLTICKYNNPSFSVARCSSLLDTTQISRQESVKHDSSFPESPIKRKRRQGNSSRSRLDPEVGEIPKEDRCLKHAVVISAKRETISRVSSPLGPAMNIALISAFLPFQGERPARGAVAQTN